MKKMIIFATAIAVMFLASAAGIYAQDTASSLVINVNGIRSNEGKVMMVLKKSADMASTDYICPSMAEASTGGVTFTAEGLTKGEVLYIFIFHDQNGNMTMDFDENHRPLEGFVTTPGEMFPSVEITGPGTEVTVEMTYLN